MNGVTKGLQLIADFFKMMVKAIEKMDVPALKDGMAVAKVWLGETVHEGTGLVKIDSWGLLFGSDPWKASRAAFRAYQEKYKSL